MILPSTSDLPGAIRVTYRQGLDDLRVLLVAEEVDLDERIAGLRQRIGEMRTLLRLIRPVVPEQAYATEEEGLRRATRLVRPLLQSRTLTTALDLLVAEHGGQTDTRGKGTPIDRPAFALLRDRIMRRHRELLFAMEASSVLSEITEIIPSAIKRLPNLPIAGEGFEPLREGLAVLLGRVVRRWKMVAEDPNGSNLSSWSRQVERLHNSARLLSDVAPDLLDEWHPALAELSGLLDEVDGMRRLRRTLKAERSLGERPFRREVAALCQPIRRDRTAEALAVALPWLAAPPEQLATRIGRAWMATTAPV